MAQVIREMRKVFQEVEARIEVTPDPVVSPQLCMQNMDTVMAQYFPRAGQGMNVTVLKPSFSECGLCHGQMALKRDPPITFVECTRCKHALTLPSNKDDNITFEPKSAKKYPFAPTAVSDCGVAAQGAVFNSYRKVGGVQGRFALGVTTTLQLLRSGARCFHPV